MRRIGRIRNEAKGFASMRERAALSSAALRAPHVIPANEAGLRLLDLLDAVSTRLRNALGDSPEHRAAADPVYERIERWLKLLPISDVLSLTVEDISIAYTLEDGTRRITKFPMTPIPYALLRETSRAQMRITSQWQIPWCVRTLFLEEDGTIVDEARWRTVTARAHAR